MMEVTKIVDVARDFREAARRVRPHPANPYTVDAKAVARFVDVSCAYVAQCLDDAATTLAAKEAELAAVKAENERLREALERIEAACSGWNSVTQGCDAAVKARDIARATIRSSSHERG